MFLFQIPEQRRANAQNYLLSFRLHQGVPRRTLKNRTTNKLQKMCDRIKASAALEVGSNSHSLYLLWQLRILQLWDIYNGILYVKYI